MNVAVFCHFGKAELQAVLSVQNGWDVVKRLKENGDSDLTAADELGRGERNFICWEGGSIFVDPACSVT